MSTTPPARRPTFPRLSPALAGAAALVIVLGFGLPLLTRGAAPGPAPQEPAAGHGPPAPMPPPDATGLGWSLLKLAVGLAVVCGVCILGARFFGAKPPATPGAMEVVASIAVPPCVLHLVRAGDRRLLIGTDAAGVKAVLELPRPAPELAPEPPAHAPEPPPTAPAPLTQEEVLALLLRLRAREGAPPPA